MRLHVVTALLFALVVPSVALPALAQTAEEKEAFSLFKEGRQEMEAGRCQKAIELFDRAYAVFPLPQILLREGECREQLGDLDGAMQSYLRIRTDDDKIKAKAYAAVQGLRDRLGQALEVGIDANVPGVEVRVDQSQAHPVPVTLRLPRGMHRFEFRKPGYGTVTVNRDLQGPGPQKVAADLVADGGQAVLVSGTGSFRGMVVRIDDREFAPAAAPGTPGRTAPIPLPTGIRKILCVQEGRVPFLSTFTVPADGVVEVTCQMDPVVAVAQPKPRTNPWKWVTFGAGTAVTVAGAGLTGWYFGTKASGKVVKGTDYHEGWIGVGMMGVGVTAAIVSLFVFPDRPAAGPAASNHPPVRPVLAASPVPGGGVASFSVGF